MKRLLFGSLILVISNATAQQTREISFPNIPGYETVSVDLHMHTVFSDGSVWPDIRVYEAVKDGVDLIATTEHLEYQPHKEDIPHPNRNRAYDLASKIARNHDLMVVNGSEITRSMPPGHSNAVFIEDANKLLLDDPRAVFEEANRQGAFTFWNHPMWVDQYPDGVAKLTDMHRQLIEDKLLHGIEVVNDLTYSDEALQIALDNNLTILGTSDVHGLIDWRFEVAAGGHRPVTLVFAETRDPQSVRQALMEGRTTVFFKNLLVGREAHMVPLAMASLEVISASYSDKHTVLPVVIRNNSPVTYRLENLSPYSLQTGPDIIEIKAQAETTVEIRTIDRKPAFDFKMKVLNGVTAPGQHPEITLKITTS